MTKPKVVAVHDPSTSHERLHWAMLLLRAHLSGCARAVRHYPTLGNLDLSTNDHNLTALIANLARKSIAEQQIAEDPNITEHKTIAKKESLRRRAADWAPTRRTSKTLAILNRSGLPAPSPKDTAALLRAHWHPTFTGDRIDEELMKPLARYIQVAPDDIDWELDFEEFSTLLDRMGDSAPGPDGIPYSALQLAPEPI